MVGDELVQPIVGCLGFPVAGNATQYVAERALKAIGSDWRVVTSLVQPALLEDAIRGARAMRFGGLAFTEAHQKPAAAAMDQLSPSAQISGLIQVAKRFDEVWMGADLRGDAISALLDSEEFESGRILVRGDEALQAILDQALASRSQSSLPTSTSTTRNSPEGSSIVPLRLVEPESETHRPISMLVIAGQQAAPLRAEWKQMPLIERAKVLLIDEESQQAPWKEMAESRGCLLLTPRDLQSMMLVEMLKYWTQLDIPKAIVREALDEYHGW